MAFVVVTSLLEIVDQHLSHPNPSLNNILDDDDTQLVFLLSKKLRILQHFLETQTVNQSLDAEIRDVAAKAEAEIESKLRDLYLASTNQDEACCGLHQTLQQVLKDVEALEVRIQIEKESRSAKDQSQSSPEALKLENKLPAGGSTSTHHHDLEPENQMVGCDDEFRKIKNMIIGQQSSEQLEVIPVTGMGGIGKTTLAKKVYDDPDIMSKFYIRAWAVVSQEPDVKRILISLLACIVPTTNELYSKERDQLADQLRKQLLGQRYLIVIDDIWSSSAWDAIKQCFPDNFSRSRILMTTPEKEVAEYASSRKSIHTKCFLNSKESWHLFVTKVFEGKDVPIPELKTIGRSIVMKCHGLPLAIVVMAGLLRALDKSVEAWDGVDKNMNSLDEIDPNNQCLGLLSLSYNYLPSHLKACFLYFGVFPEDRDILATKLINLWVAEGFLKKEKEMSKSLEEVAESYLHNLVNRNLVQVSQQSFDGKIKSCKLHDMLHEISVNEARRGKLLGVRKQFQSADSCRWISCKSTSWPTSDGIHSILYFGEDVYLSKRNLVFSCMMLLRVLDLSLIKCWHGAPSEIVELVHLRYLALTTVGSLDKFQLFKLQNLQTLIICSWREECCLQLPRDILNLPRLRHAHLDKRATAYLPNVIQESIQTLFWLKVNGRVPRTTDFAMVPNLKELGVYIDNDLPPGAFDSLVQLRLLERLKFERRNVKGFYLPTDLPQNLKKLTLCNTYLLWEDMDIIGRLPMLEVLKLKEFAFSGPTWKPADDGGFKTLKLLLIARSDLKYWNTTDDHFKVLERLILRFCLELEELPSEFESSNTLQLIELENCYPILVESARKIQEEQQNYGNYELVIRDLGAKIKLSTKESSEGNESE
ncbi:PREDICTED: putative late blight resistance protein homolog R1B-23 [Ipomoea nil]|uniref:putative late blight resistance protein homolog R1B-23 n=1 Tax=Ipomoea nil TaxID=35883 RepID=UPI000900D185|nr:PREDICTED: putative late blight resistance protein homolog R1B-23 [Ipomoea nil]